MDFTLISIIYSTIGVIFYFRVSYSHRYLFNAIPDTNRKANLGKSSDFGTVRYAEGLWRMCRHGLVIAHCTDSEDFPNANPTNPNRNSKGNTNPTNPNTRHRCECDTLN